MGADSAVKSEKPESFQKFEDAVKKILTVSKEEVQRREQEAKINRKNSKDKKSS